MVESVLAQPGLIAFLPQVRGRGGWTQSSRSLSLLPEFAFDNSLLGELLSSLEDLVSPRSSLTLPSLLPKPLTVGVPRVLPSNLLMNHVSGEFNCVCLTYSSILSHFLSVGGCAPVGPTPWEGQVGQPQCPILLDTTTW